jgi:hypothetical protein
MKATFGMPALRMPLRRRSRAMMLTVESSSDRKAPAAAAFDPRYGLMEYGRRVAMRRDGDNFVAFKSDD